MHNENDLDYSWSHVVNKNFGNRVGHFKTT